MTTIPSECRKRPRSHTDDEFSDMVDGCLGGSEKRAKEEGESSPSSTISVQNGSSPPSVNRRGSSSPRRGAQDAAIRRKVLPEDGTEPEALEVRISQATGVQGESGYGTETGPTETVGISQTSWHYGESIVVKRLKDLCSIKEPTVNVGIEMVGAAYLLKRTRPSCDHEIELAMEQAVEAAKALFHAEHLRNNGVQQLFKSQKSLKKLL